MLNQIMTKFKTAFVVVCFFMANFSFAQQKDSAIINSIVQEAMNHSQLESLAHDLMDKIGPRLVGSPKMQQAHDWAGAKYNSWGINAHNEKVFYWCGC